MDAPLQTKIRNEPHNIHFCKIVLILWQHFLLKSIKNVQTNRKCTKLKSEQQNQMFPNLQRTNYVHTKGNRATVSLTPSIQEGKNFLPGNMRQQQVMSKLRLGRGKPFKTNFGVEKTPHCLSFIQFGD